MIDVGSIAGLYEREHELHAYYHHCGRWNVLDLAGMVRRGQGSRRLPLTVRYWKPRLRGWSMERVPQAAERPVG